MKTRLVSLVLLLSFLIAACGSRDLSRGNAEEMIEASEEVLNESSTVTATSGFVESGEQQGLWTSEGSNIFLSERAASDISMISGMQITPTDPFSIKVEVTGIAQIGNSNNIRTAEFVWSYDGLQPLVRRFAISGGEGRAIFQMYDDGWRINSVELQKSDQPITLSDAEINDVADDIAAQETRKAEEVAQMDSLWSIGKPQKTLYYHVPGSSVWYRTDFTDNLMVSCYASSQGGPWSMDSAYWYGGMDEPKKIAYRSQIRFMVRRKHDDGRVAIYPVTYGSMGMPVDEFLSLVKLYRDRWRTMHSDKIDGPGGFEFAKPKYTDVYVSKHNSKGLKEN